jgi:uncharacterized protein (TIGR00369 family)
MEAKKVSETSVVMSQLMTPQDANVAGNVHGGVIMKLVDSAAGIVSKRHSRANVVTASIDNLDFHHPVFVGDLLILKASLNLVGRTSMEVGVHVESENLITRETRHVASAYLTLVALDDEHNPTIVPPITLETKEEMRRNLEAQARREIRRSQRKDKK